MIKAIGSFFYKLFLNPKKFLTIDNLLGVIFLYIILQINFFSFFKTQLDKYKILIYELTSPKHSYLDPITPAILNLKREIIAKKAKNTYIDKHHYYFQPLAEALYPFKINHNSLYEIKVIKHGNKPTFTLIPNAKY